MPPLIKPIIAIDGPAASGKGTLARRLAAVLGFAHLDTGKLYRVAAWRSLEQGIAPYDAFTLVAALTPFDPSWIERPELIDPTVADRASIVSTLPQVRHVLLSIQQDFAQNLPLPARGAILDGRDLGTVVCPNAPVKFFITASPQIRAQRRTQDLQNHGNPIIYEQVLADLMRRDQRDQNRSVAPLKAAQDAVILDTSNLTIKDAMDFLVGHIGNSPLASYVNV